MDIEQAAPPIAGLILAGGRSSRMGGIEKSRICLDGTPLVYKIAVLLESLFSEVILITNQPNLHEDLPPGVMIAPDFHRGRGPLGGLHAGLRRIQAQAVFCVACDMPSLRRDLIEAQLQSFRAAYARGCQILIPRIGRLIEPLHGIYVKTVEPAVDRICRGRGGYSIRILLRQVRTCYWDLEDTAENRSAFFNLNTPKDLRVHLEASGE